MRAIRSENYEKMSRAAADLIAAQLKSKPDLILCASAGGTPTGLYERLAARYARKPRLFQHIRILQIDEWGGLRRGSPATCEIDILSKLAAPLRVRPERFIGFKTDAPDPERECERIARWLDKYGPIDICILGLGINGHIAMNEPADQLQLRPHVARLAPTSLKHGMLKHLTDKPRYGLTIGMGDILSSKTILLVVNGRHKRACVKRLFSPHVTTQFPASFLWLHGDTTLICDREAAKSSLVPA